MASLIESLKESAGKVTLVLDEEESSNLLGIVKDGVFDYWMWDRAKPLRQQIAQQIREQLAADNESQK